ncbi:MAG: hypothetical protein E7555_06925 [Ruminococcaceae bacterium]|nr:hypothetical protein [Oscillospiraceae bacterium]
MLYSMNKKNYKDFSVVEIGKLPARAYFIPFKTKAQLDSTDFITERYSSDAVTVLSGEWDFRYYADCTTLEESLDTDKLSFDKVTVPSTWQRTGYEPPCYLNTRFPFNNVDNSIYPSVPDSSCGVYRKKFNIQNTDKKYIITFLGVISSLDLYINGKYVGYSEGAHNSAEFDISDFLTEGENELVAVVYKWSNATYLECQDMFRENGIFRDVLLTECESSYIFDICYTPEKVGENKYSLTVMTQIKGADSNDLTLEIFDGDNKIAETSLSTDNKEIIGENEDTFYAFFPCLDVTEWNAENPKVYNAVATLSKDGKDIQLVRTIIGFKTIEIKKDVYFFNSQPIKMKGVNHHDSTPDKGYTMSHEDILKDIKLMKSLNVNTVRTSHYPPDPFFIIACSVYGLYVCDEADIEAHGCGDFLPYMNLIADSLQWLPRFCDRVKRMVMRDRNNPCIAMWSLGNETGHGICHDAAFGVAKAISPEIPVHYESCNGSDRKAYDIASNMYERITSFYGENLTPKYVRKDIVNLDKPYFLCEYAHAMGVGPGSLEEYWDAFYSSDKYMGGCIWEWVDHAACTYNKNLKYTYGGDHGERIHDSNFCVDGLIYPDRTPHTGAWEMKEAYRPIRIRHYEANEFFFKNTNYFTNADVYSFTWQLLKNGEVCESGDLTVDISPNSEKRVILPIKTKMLKTEEYHITFICTRDGEQVSKQQCTLQETYVEHLVRAETSEDVKITETDTTAEIEARFGQMKVVFDKASGEMISFISEGKEFINQSPARGVKGFLPNIKRAYHDNEKWQKENYWTKGELSKADTKATDFGIEVCGKKAIISVDYEIASESTKLFNATIVYTVFSSGKIKVLANLKKVNDEIEPDLPRFGLSFEMPKDMENIEYFGLGEKENLADFKAQATLGIYKAKVEDTHEPYIFPQENGCHTEVRYLEVSDNDGFGLIFANCQGNFSFNIHDYTVQALEDATHQEEIKRADTSLLNLDGFLSGTGSGSCGPYTLEKYRVLCDNELSFSFEVAPIIYAKA